MRASRVTRMIVCTVILCTILISALPAVASACANPTIVYRLYNKVTGVHFYTSDVEEKHALLKYPEIWVFEGIGYEIDNDYAIDPLYRFYNMKNGTHFYTADPAEKERVKSTLAATYKYEGPAFTVSCASGSGDEVYRFYNKRTGTHFYTADEAEKANVQAKLGSTYTYEGVAYYLP